MFQSSSILSRLLKKTVGVPEVNLNKLPFANKLVGDWEKKSMQDLVKLWREDSCLKTKKIN